MAKKRLLIVDDDARNIFALTALLQTKGFVCVSCSSALEALDILRTDAAIDAVLIDMMMPDMDGYEAIPLIKNTESHRETPIFAVTAQVMPDDREKSLQAGATD